jgi:hypothetical protein
METNSHDDTKGTTKARPVIQEAFRWAALARRRIEDSPDHKALDLRERGPVIR